MASRADIIVNEGGANINWNANARNYLVKVPNGDLYFFHIDGAIDVSYKKSTDGGLTWGTAVVVFTGTTTQLAVWYDRWSGIAAGLIHVAYTESVTDDTLYRTINTESADALSTQTVIFAGASMAAGGSLAISRARGGNVYCYTNIDGTVEGGFFRLLNANVPNGAWDAARTINEALATDDMALLLPGWAADNQDMMMIFWDISANEISRQLYDDSANTWAETSIATSMVEPGTATFNTNFAATVDITNSRNVMIAWTQADLANADLRCWKVTEAAITEVTNVVLNSTDDQGGAAILIDTDTERWYAFYVGKSDGSETFATSLNIYYKYSTDSGSTWSAEIRLTTLALPIKMIYTSPRCRLPFAVVYFDDQAQDLLRINVSTLRPRAASMIGL